MAEHPSKRFRLNKKLGFWIAALVNGCLVLEILLSIFYPQTLVTKYSKIWRPDKTFGWRRQENVNTKLNSGEGTVHFLTDSDGFRINLNNASSDDFDRSASILILGDSFLEAIQVENRYTIPQVLKENLCRTHDANIMVYNSSCGGWNPNHYYLEAKRLAGRKIDVAITFLYVSNDVINTRVDQFKPRQPAKPHRLRFPHKLSGKEFTDSILYPINDFLETRSQLFTLLKNRTQWLRVKLGLSTYYFSDVFKRSQSHSDCWDVTADVCKSVHDTFSEQGVPCIFVLLPAPYQVHENIFDKYARAFDIDLDSVDIHQPNRLLKNTFESHALVLVDPLEYMRDEAERGQILFGHIDSHLNRDGHRAVADYITPMVESFIPDDQ